MKRIFFIQCFNYEAILTYLIKISIKKGGIVIFYLKSIDGLIKKIKFTALHRFWYFTKVLKKIWQSALKWYKTQGI